MRRPTVRDVADAAGVSTQTVSRVVNDQPRVAPETRAIVQHWIDALGYQPSAVARGLQSDRSFSVGVVMFGMQFFGPAQTLMGIVDACSSQGLATLLSELPARTNFDISGAVGSLLERRVDGIVLSVPNAESTIAQLGAQLQHVRVPIVFVRGIGPPSFSSVSVDNEAAMMSVVDHLVRTGRRRIAHIGGVPDWDETTARVRGWRRGVESAGLEADPTLFVSGDWTAQSGADAVRTLLDRNVEFDAVAVANDQMALGAIAYLRERGIRVPDDVAITGFDDLPEMAWVSPSLTSVRQPLADLGARAVDILLSEVGVSDVVPTQLQIPTTLIERASSCGDPRREKERPDRGTP